MPEHYYYSAVDGTISPVSAQEEHRIELLRDRFQAAAQVNLILDVAARLAVGYTYGAQWQRSVKRQPSLTDLLPQRQLGDFKATINLIGQFVRRYYATLGIADWRAAFRADTTDEESHLTARVVQKVYDSWHPKAKLVNWWDMMNLQRVIIGSGAARFVFDPKAPNGIKVVTFPACRLSLDPANVNPDLEGHEYIIDTQALSVAEIKRRTGIQLETEQTLGQIFSTHEEVMRSLHGTAADSRTRGALIHSMYDENFEHVTIVVRNFATIVNDGGNKDLREDFYVIYDGPWAYGNPYMKIDLFPNAALAHGNGLPIELIQSQDTLNYAYYSPIRAGINRASLKWRYKAGTIQNPDTAFNNVEGGHIILKQTARFANAFELPEPVQMPKYDVSLLPLAQSTVEFMQMQSDVTGPVRGEPVKRGQAASAYELLVRQATVMLQKVANTDAERLNGFLNRVGRVMTTRLAKKDVVRLREVVGKGTASKAIARLAQKKTLRGETSCSLSPTAFIAESPAEKRARIEHHRQIGLLTEIEAKGEIYEQTGLPVYKTQGEDYQNAEEALRQVLAGKFREPSVFDNHDVLLSVFLRAHRKRITAEYTAKQVGALEEFMLEIRTMQFKDTRMQEAIGAEMPLGAPEQETGAPQESRTPPLTGEEPVAAATAPGQGVPAAAGGLGG